MSRKMCQDPLRRKLVEADQYDRIAVKKPLLKKKNNFKKLQWTKVTKYWTTEQ